MNVNFKPHVSINVKSVNASVEFYAKLFGVPPVKHYQDRTTVHSILLDDQGHDSRQTRTGYAKFDLQTPALNFVLNELEQAPDASLGGTSGALSHMGLQVENTDAVIAMRMRAVSQGMTVRDEMAVSCCYARQDKFWLADPDGNEWEVFAVLEHLTPEQLKLRDLRGFGDLEQGGAAACATPAPVPSVQPDVAKSRCASACASL